MKYSIRRTILKALFRFYCPQNLNTILCDDQILLLGVDNTLILNEWDLLTQAGYILPVPGFPECRSLSPMIRFKLEAGNALMDDPFLAGEMALKG